MQATFIYILLFNIIVSVAQRCTYSIELPKNAIVLFPTERSRRGKKTHIQFSEYYAHIPP